jgi:hypothetical protein
MTLKDIRPALREFLLDDAAISAAVGGTRVFPLVLPQGIIDTSIVYTRISGIGDHHMQGPSGLNRPRYQIDAWAESIDDAIVLADQIKQRIDGFSGTMLFGASPQSGVDIRGIFFVDEREDFDNDAHLYRVSRDYMIWFEER